MNEKPKSIWKKPLTGLRGFAASLLIVFVAALVMGTFVTIVVPQGNWTALVEGVLVVMIFYIVAVGIAFGVYQAIRWLFSRRNLARSAFGLACLVTFIGLAYAEEDLRGWLAWNHFKHQWQAKGETFDLKDVVPPPVPDDLNFALTPIVASTYGSMLDKNGHEIRPRNTNVVDRLQISTTLDTDYSNWPTNGNWAKATVTDLTAWQQYYRALAAQTNFFVVPPQPQSPAADVLLALGRYDSTIEELREAAKLPDSRFPLEYDKDDPAAILLPHLAALKRASLVLQLRAIAELQNGQSGRALADVKLMLRLADAVRNEAILISHLVRIAIVQLAIQPIYEGLAEHQWTDAQLAELDSELAKLDLLADYKSGVRGELAFQGGLYGYLRRHPAQLSGIFGPDPNGYSPQSLALRLIPKGWFYQNQLRSSRFIVQYLLPLADTNQQTALPALVRNAEKTYAVEFKHLTPYNFLEHLLLSNLNRIIERFAYGQESVDLARVGIALERYRLAFGQYPDSLDVLAPRFIESIPHDIIGGQPLHYRLTGDGNFVLYSVGWNERDDGGKVVLNGRSGTGGTVNINAGDWVWRYPPK